MNTRFVLAQLIGTVVLLLSVARADAQIAQIIITTEPPIPRAGEPVTMVVLATCGCPGHTGEFVRNGFTIDIRRSDGCVAACLGPRYVRYDLGVLPAGVYTVRQHGFDRPADFTVLTTFAVAEVPPIPTLSFASIAALAVALTGASLFILRR